MEGHRGTPTTLYCLRVSTSVDHTAKYRPGVGPKGRFPEKRT